MNFWLLYLFEPSDANETLFDVTSCVVCESSLSVSKFKTKIKRSRYSQRNKYYALRKEKLTKQVTTPGIPRCSFKHERSPTFLDFSDGTRTGVFNVVWPVAITTSSTSPWWSGSTEFRGSLCAPVLMNGCNSQRVDRNIPRSSAHTCTS